MDTHSAKDIIRSQVSIAEVAAKYTQLQSVGGKMKGLSPFKSEKTPSFFVDIEKNLFYCFSTGQGGDVFTLIEIMEGVDFLGALTYLANEYGIDITSKNSGFEKKKKAILSVCQDALTFFQAEIPPSIQTYLTQRHLTQEIQEKWGIGYAAAQWTALTDYLRKKGHSEEDMIDAGVCIKKNGKVFDRFRDRVMFPLFENNVCIGFAGRLSPTNTNEEGKYINISETLLYKKKKYCYGFDDAKKPMRDMSMAILTEGYTDVIAMHSIGYKMTIASSGTATTKEHLATIARYTKNVILLFDGDSAGIAASRKTAEIAYSIGMEVKIGLCPEGNDPADIAFQDSKQMKDIIKNAQKAVVFFLLHTKKKEIVDCMREEIFPLISVMQDPIQREVALKEVADQIHLSMETITSSYDFFIQNRYQSVSNYTKKPPTLSIDRKKKQHEHIVYAYTYLKRNDIDMSRAEEEIAFFSAVDVESDVSSLLFEEMFSRCTQEERMEKVKTYFYDIFFICLLDIYKEKMDTILIALEEKTMPKKEREQLEKEYRDIKKKRENITL